MIAALILLLAAPSHAAGFKWRGVLEGFYGRPWTWKQRERMVDWMPKHALNLLVIAPKDEPAQRDDWRQPLSSDYLAHLSKLRNRAQSKSVTLGWTLSPFDVKPGSQADLTAALVKFRQVLGLGVRQLALAFDDTEPAISQIDFANKVIADLAPDFPDLQMTFVPAVYWGKAAPSKYLDYVAARLDSRFLVGWTGPGILSETITAEDGRRFRDYIKHKLVLGDNYPVQDRLVDQGPLYLGPLVGRDAGLEDTQEAFLSNASPLPEASKLPLATAADYMRDPAHYDAEKSWRRAINELGGRSAKWLELLASECSVSWISDPPPSWIRPAKFPLDFPARLREGLAPELNAELRPWAQRLTNNPPSVAWSELLPRRDSGGASEIHDALQKLGALASLYPPTEEHGWSGALLPWVGILGVSANRALAYDEDPSKAPWVPESFWRWRMRARMIPLLAARALLERHLDYVESSWNHATRPAPKMRWLVVWLWAESWIKPSGFTSVLFHELAHYHSTGEPGRLPELFAYLETLPVRARAATGRQAPELEPWLAKLSGYGRLGRLSLQYKKIGAALPEDKKKAWDLDRERLRSSNGLELAVRLKYRLDAYAAWRRTPPEKRPTEFKVDWPADPSELF